STNSVESVSMGFALWLALFAGPVVIALAATAYERATWLVNLWILSAAINGLVAALDLAHVTTIQEVLIGTTFIGRTAGLTIHPNHLGTVCAMALPVAIWQTAAPTSAWHRTAHVLMTISIAFGLLASGSRAAFAGAVLGVIIIVSTVLFHVHRKTAGIVLAGAVTTVLLAVGYSVVTHQHFIVFDRLTSSIMGGYNDSF